MESPPSVPPNKSRISEVKKEMKKKEIALISTLAALYILLVVGLGPLSFNQFQFRVANILLGIVPLAGLPAVFGITLGVLIGNITSTLGPIDMLSAIPSFLGCLSIYYLRKKSVLLGLTVYTIIISVWVSYLLYIVVNLPFLENLFLILIGVGVVTIGFGYILYKTLLKTGGEKLWLR